MKRALLQRFRGMHAWIGIVTALPLFVAFYAGALTMFEDALTRWARPPSALSAPPPLTRIDGLAEAVFDRYPRAREAFQVHLGAAAAIPARLTWPAPDESAESADGRSAMLAASLDAAGGLEVARLAPPALPAFVDVLHQRIGLPLPRRLSDPLMGLVALSYALVLVSGLLALLPSLARDLFELRLSASLKRMWLDVHNALGLFSLPFHFVMALTSVIFAFHTLLYDAQASLFWQGGRAALFAHDHPEPPEGREPLPVSGLIAAITFALPQVQWQTLDIEIERTDSGALRREVIALGRDPRNYDSSGGGSYYAVDAYTGAVTRAGSDSLQRSGWSAAVDAFFALHFGSFGGLPIRWAYAVLGLSGALLFYTGNLLWIESRRRAPPGGPAGPRGQRFAIALLADATVGVCLGCMAGLSATIAATPWLHGRVDDLALAHEVVYYVVFTAAIGLAFFFGAARAAVALLRIVSIATLAIPVASLVGWFVPGSGVRVSAVPGVDVTAAVAAVLFWRLAARTARRGREGPQASVWAAYSARL